MNARVSTTRCAMRARRDLSTSAQLGMHNPAGGLAINQLLKLKQGRRAHFTGAVPGAHRGSRGLCEGDTHRDRGRCRTGEGSGGTNDGRAGCGCSGGS